MKRKRRKIKWKNVFLFFIIIFCFVGLIISIVYITRWIIDSNNTNNQLNDIEKRFEITEISEDETEIIQNEAEITKTDPYWDYMKMNLIDVNFKDLKNTNSDAVGWIQVNGTNINYPFVQTDNNDFYLTHSFDKSYNKAGWVFLDYRNNIQNTNKNTIIYAHGRFDNTMFGSLRKVLTNGWLNDSDNYVIKLATEEENTLWQVFSVYRIPTTSDYLEIDFNDNQKFLDFSTMLLNRSTYNFNTTVNGNDKIITLSTCYNDDDKVVLHAKLIKRNKK